jgi:hypothetical protein
MDPVRSSRSPARCLAGAAAIAAMWWVAFENGDRIPILTYVNLGFHEFGHFLTYAFSDLVTALMGSIAQVAVPLALAVYFFLFRDDWLAAGLCLAWGATSAVEVAIYVADAPFEELQLIGGSHDWAFILGPDGYDAIDRAGPLADTIRDVASVGILTGLALCLAGPFRGAARRRDQEEPAAAASRVTPASSARAASATSGSAPRSASSPK